VHDAQAARAQRPTRATSRTRVRRHRLQQPHECDVWVRVARSRTAFGTVPVIKRGVVDGWSGSPSARCDVHPPPCACMHAWPADASAGRNCQRPLRPRAVMQPCAPHTHTHTPEGAWVGLDALLAHAVAAAQVDGPPRVHVEGRQAHRARHVLRHVRHAPRRVWCGWRRQLAGALACV
jgi:hypothetical protein